MPAVISCYGQKGGVGSNGISELGAAGEVGTGQGHTGHWRGGRILNGDGHVAGVWQG